MLLTWHDSPSGEEVRWGWIIRILMWLNETNLLSHLAKQPAFAHLDAL